ncbi:hypothetical protein ACH5RR_032850 [Cinchona calisaya]|uniref:Uncharacterized protein n=1 Tax=Cinchona calisaya TaxID=153742 RepID=A0ABD2YPK4_9GENT
MAKSIVSPVRLVIVSSIQGMDSSQIYPRSTTLAVFGKGISNLGLHEDNFANLIGETFGVRKTSRLGFGLPLELIQIRNNDEVNNVKGISVPQNNDDKGNDVPQSQSVEVNIQPKKNHIVQNVEEVLDANQDNN